ncbi:NAD(P)H-hydrate dehydratase [Streptococcus dentiloxodontae]
MELNRKLAQKVIRPRQIVSHKGTYGRVLLIGGFYPYGGAIIMSALACVNSGAGLVTVATEKENIPALHAHLPEAMAFEAGDLNRLNQQITAADLVLIGPGLSESAKAEQVFLEVLHSIKSKQALIIDGSALNLLATDKPECFGTKQLILTPHQKEWERLSELTIPQQSISNTQAALSDFPKETILVAKSHATKVFQGQKVSELKAGGPYQATGGMGDTLAGMIAGFAAQFGANFEAVGAAVWLHSAIADDLSHESYVTLPTAISAAIPKWMKSISQEN